MKSTSFKHLRNAFKTMSVDYNKKIEKIGRSIVEDHMDLETCLINIIDLVYDLRFDYDLSYVEKTLKILKDCKFDLVTLKYDR